ncbi:histidine kinase dimerization/phosphoacceptor domain -containing protein [Chitinophaga barathri]|uniref:histidine kinase n=1 Tax=Chitinophaga barathri TaxID=1647451 RepID=A0A3N4MCW2_9BACT|nr:histidine kinase dimerization/phosphoacceptor domain -containing protein [Chitinophaga barathri]RPD41398.1 hypothetical protein EG028_08750 [Chitinophaga barathri]
MWRAWLITVLFILSFLTASSQGPAEMRKKLALTAEDSTRIQLLEELARHYLYLPDENPRDLDSAAYFITAAEALSIRLGRTEDALRCRAITGNLYLERGDVRRAIQLIPGLPPSSQVVLLINTAFHYVYKPGEFGYDLDSAILYGRQAMAIAKKNGFREDYEDASNIVTRAYFEGGTLTGANAHLQVLEGAAKAHALHTLGYVYYTRPGAEQTDLDSAFHYTRQAIIVARQLNLKEPLEKNLYMLACIHCKAKQFTEASLLLPEISGDWKAEILNKLSGYYLQQGWPDSAYRSTMEALVIYQAQQHKEGIEACTRILKALDMKKEYTDKQVRGLPGMERYQKLMALGREYLSDFPAYDLGRLQVASVYFAEAAAIAEYLPQDSCRHAARLEMGRAALMMGNLAEGLAIFGKVITDLRNRNDNHGQALAWYSIGNTVRRQRVNLGTIANAYLQSAKLAILSKDKILEINATLYHAYYLMDDGRPEPAEKILLDLQQKYPDPENPIAFRLHNYLSIIYRSRGSLNMALEHSLKSIRLQEGGKNPENIHSLYEKVGDIYANLGQPAKSIVWYQHALDAVDHHPPADFDYIIQSKLAQEMVKNGKAKEALALLLQMFRQFPPQTFYSKASMHNALAICYNTLGRYDLAEKYFLENASNAERIRMSDKVYTEMHYNIGKFYLERGEFMRADYHLKKSLRYTADIASVASAKDVHLLLFRSDSARGDLLSAIQHYQQYKSFNDSIFNSLTSRQIHELQIQYETEKKDQDLVLKEKDILLKEQDILLLTRQGILDKSQLEQALLKRKQIETEADRKDQELKLNIQLLAKQKELQESQERMLAQEKIHRKATYGGVGLLLVILGLLYYSYQMKRRSNKRLEAKQKEINQQNVSLQHLVSEKEWLLKEIHHRVKNNLQIVMSLLNSQSAYLQDAALGAIRDSQHRVQAISLIHKKLYQTDDVAMIDMPQYIHELAEYLMDCFDTSQNIRFDLQVANIKMDVSRAVPLGLILNEAITNSIKYAFPQKRDGAISVKLERQAGGCAVLTIADDGVGLPPDFDHLKSSSLGMSLMQGLSEDLGGHFSLHGRQGTHISVAFDYEDDPNPLLTFSTPENLQYE